MIICYILITIPNIHTRFPDPICTKRLEHQHKLNHVREAKIQSHEDRDLWTQTVCHDSGHVKIKTFSKCGLKVYIAKIQKSHRNILKY